MRTVEKLAGRVHWQQVSGIELVFGVLFIQLITSVAVLARLFGPCPTVIAFSGFALLMYYGTVSPREHGARAVLRWVGVPWHHWAGAVFGGGLLGGVVTAMTAIFGHSIRVAEAVHNEVLAVTLGPIAEELCLRGLLLPLLVRTIGVPGAVLISSALFAGLHLPASMLKLACITMTGASYGLSWYDSVLQPSPLLPTRATTSRSWYLAYFVDVESKFQ